VCLSRFFFSKQIDISWLLMSKRVEFIRRIAPHRIISPNRSVSYCLLCDLSAFCEQRAASEHYHSLITSLPTTFQYNSPPQNQIKPELKIRKLKIIE